MNSLFLACVFFGAMALCSAQAASDAPEKTSAAAPEKAQPKSVTKLKPQTTCPVMGDKIDKSFYVDYKGKRIYACCGSCPDIIKKDPEKYIKKLEAMGQSVEVISNEPKNESKNDTSKTNIKSMKMKDDTTMSKAANTEYWTCPMHPEIHQTGPGRCPICGMNLEFKKNDKDTTKIKNADHSKKKM